MSTANLLRAYRYPRIIHENTDRLSKPSLVGCSDLTHFVGQT
jgi:hypothetical protein